MTIPDRLVDLRFESIRAGRLEKQTSVFDFRAATSSDLGNVFQSVSELQRRSRRLFHTQTRQELQQLPSAESEMRADQPHGDGQKKDVLRLVSLIGIGEHHPAFEFYRKSCSSDPVDEEEESDSESSSTASV